MTCRRSVRWQNRFEPRLERSEHLLLGQIRKLLAKTLEVTEGVLVDEAHQTEEFEQRVLQRCCCEEKLVPLLQSQLERVGDDVVGL